MGSKVSNPNKKKINSKSGTVVGNNPNKKTIILEGRIVVRDEYLNEEKKQKLSIRNNTEDGTKHTKAINTHEIPLKQYPETRELCVILEDNTECLTLTFKNLEYNDLPCINIISSKKSLPSFYLTAHK
jgi:hypothetical protein